jgi:hypothetical protein
VAIMNAHDRIAEQIWGVVVAAIQSQTERPIGGMQFELADATTIAHAAAKNVLAILPELLTDEQMVDATARVLYGGYEASEGTKGEVRVTLAAAAKALTGDQS